MSRKNITADEWLQTEAGQQALRLAALDPRDAVIAGYQGGIGEGIDRLGAELDELRVKSKESNSQSA